MHLQLHYNGESNWILEAVHGFGWSNIINTNDSTKSVTADGITGYGARISIGKSF